MIGLGSDKNTVFSTNMTTNIETAVLSKMVFKTKQWISNKFIRAIRMVCLFSQTFWWAKGNIYTWSITCFGRAALITCSTIKCSRLDKWVNLWSILKLCSKLNYVYYFWGSIWDLTHKICTNYFWKCYVDLLQ